MSARPLSRVSSPLRVLGVPGVSGVLGALVILAFAGPAAAADPVADYIAARDRYIAEIRKLDADPKKQDAMFALDEKARADLQKQLAAMLGPLAFKGLGKTATFSPGALFEGDLESGRPDGLIFRDANDSTRIFVSPEPVFGDWLAREAKMDGMPPAFRDGVKAAMSSDLFFTETVGQDAAFTSYVSLPVQAGADETIYAVLGLFSQDDAGDNPPADLVIARLAGGRLTIGGEPAPEAKAIAACGQVWKRSEAKAEQLRAAARKGKGPDDPRWEEAAALSQAGGAAFRACFAQEAPKQPFFAALMTRANTLLAKMRGG